jgi:hypothetical protein
MVDVDIEEYGGKGAPLADTSVHAEPSGLGSLNVYLSFATGVEVPDERYQMWVDAPGCENAPKCFPVNAVKGLLVVNEGGKKRCPVCIGQLTETPHGE